MGVHSKAVTGASGKMLPSPAVGYDEIWSWGSLRDPNKNNRQNYKNVEFSTNSPCLKRMANKKDP